jgi:hypothetical protein
MKLALSTLAALAALMPVAGQAQTAAAPAAKPATTAAAAKFNLDTPIETLVADAKAKAVLDADLPGLTGHPAYDSFKAMSLRGVQPFSQGALTDEMLKKTETDLAAVK